MVVFTLITNQSSIIKVESLWLQVTSKVKRLVSSHRAADDSDDMKIMIITYSVTLFKCSTRDKHASVLFLLHSCIHLTWFLPCYGLKLLAHQQMWLFWGKSGGSIPHLHRDISCRVAFPPLPECHRRWCLTQECDIPTHTHIQTHTHTLSAMMRLLLSAQTSHTLQYLFCLPARYESRSEMTPISSSAAAQALNYTSQFLPSRRLPSV